MTIKITKPEIDIRSKLNELDKPSGVAGEAMLRAETPEEQRRLIGLGQRNMIINGDFQVWQRGTSGTSGYVADRWRGFSTTSQSKQYDSEVGNYIQFTSSNPALIYYGIELSETGQVTPFEVGETYTISLKVKSEGVMFKPNCSFRDGLGGGTNTVFSSREIKPHKGTGEWEDVVYQFTVDAAPHSTAKLFELTIVSWDYSNTPFNIAQVQMVKGKVATPFEHRSYGEEYALCQRYYQRFDADGQDFTNIGIAVGTTGNSSTKWYVPIVLPGGRMRTDPSLSFSAAGDFRCTLQHSNSDNCSSIIIGYGNPLTPNLAVIAGSSVAGVIRMFGYSASTTAWLAFDAEF